MNLTQSIGRRLLARYKRKKRAASDASLENCLAAAKAVVRQSKYCFFVTNNDAGSPSSRLVEPLFDEESFGFFIGTHPASRKVAEIGRNPHVTLAFGSEALDANLVVHGTASVRSEPEHRRRHWKGRWRLFFPNGSQGDDYVVLDLVASRLEILSFRGNVVPEPFGLKPAVLTRSDGGWRVDT